MATIEVSTWPQIRSAITSAAAGDVIKLIADIDCNDEIPEGVSSKITIEKTITIDGSYTENDVIKNHEIRNLRTQVSSPVEIFDIHATSSGASLYPIFKNIDFVNLILDAPLFSQSNPNYFTIRNCRFTGKRTHNLIVHQSTGYGGMARIYSSFFNIPYYGASANERVPLASAFNRGGSWPMSTYAHYCRFKETYTGTYTPTTTNWQSNCGVSSIWLNGCRVEGEIISTSSWDGSKNTIVVLSTNALNGGTPTMQNVIDCDIYTYGLGETAATVQVQTPKGIFKTPICRWEDKTYSFTLATPLSGTIPATESQMQDTTWLIQHNFDVVPSDA